MPNLETVRYYSDALYSTHHGFLSMSASFAIHSTNLIVFVDFNRDPDCTYGFGFSPDEEHSIWVPNPTRRLVLNIRYDPKEGMHSNVAAVIPTYERLELREIVLIVTTPSSWGRREVNVFAWQLCTTFPSEDILWHSVACTIVGVPDIIATTGDNPGAASQR
jgi:hypothetical protein